MSKYLVIEEDYLNKILEEHREFESEEMAEIEARNNTSTNLRSFIVLKFIKKFSPSRQINEFFYE